MKKFSLKKLILVMIAAVFCSGFLLGTNFETASSVANASTPVSHHNAHQNQSQNILVTSIVSSDQTTKTIYLYPHTSNGNSSISEFFTFYSTKNSNSGLSSTETELVYDKSYDGGGPSRAVPYNGEFSSIISLSKNIQIALEKGFVMISSSAQTTSKAFNKDKDNADKITSSLYVYNNGASSQVEGTTFVKKEISSTRNDALEVDAFSFEYSDLLGLILDTIELNFKSTLNNKSLFTNHNYMKIAVPQVVLSTSDLIKPSLELVHDDNWAQSRTVLVNASDADSGLQKVEYKISGGDWIELANYSEFKSQSNENELKFVVEENGEVCVRVTDNVGNVSEESYTEENIDRVAPSLNVEINRAETDMAFDFVANFASNHKTFVSPEEFSYTVKINGGAESEKVKLFDGSNHFDASEVGEYVFTFYAEDKAGNSMEPFSRTLKLKKLLEIADVTTKYTYADGKEFAFKFNPTATDEPIFKYSAATYAGKPVDENELTVAGFILKITQNGNSAKLVNAGTYNYEFACTNEYYVVLKSGTVEIAPYSIILTIKRDGISYTGDDIDLKYIGENKNRYEYSAAAICPDYEIDKNVQIKVVYTDALGNVVEKPKNIGEYSVKFEYVLDKNYVLDKTIPHIITKRNLTVSAKNLSVTYGDVSDDNVPEFLYDIAGLLDGDNLHFDPVCNYLTDAGTYTISFKQKSGLTSQEENLLKNYNIEYVDGVFEIKKRTAVVTPTENQTKLYMTDEPTLTYSVSGLVNGDILEGLLTREKRGEENGENAGFYQILLGTLSHKNYNLTLVPSSFQITKRIAYVILNDATKVYGEENPLFTFVTNNSNILEKDIESIQKAIYVDGYQEIEACKIPVGSYKLTVSSADAENYVVVLIDATFLVTPKSITVSAKDIVAEYGETKDLEFDVQGLVNGDSLEGTLERQFGNEIGKYMVGQGTITSENNPNYEILFVSGTYEIVKKNITIVAENYTKYYGEVDALVPKIEGTDAVLDIKLVREQGEDAGTYNVYGYEFDDEHYLVSFVTGTLEILKIEISVEVFDTTKVYGTKVDPAFDYQITGLPAGKTLDLIINRVEGENVGTYEISEILLNENDAKNYVIVSFNKASLTIEKADLPLVLSDKKVTYSGSPVKIDELALEFPISYVYTLDDEVVEPSTVVNAREYKVYAEFAGNENYNPSKSNIVTLTILKKLVPITLKKCAFNYNGEIQIPEFDSCLYDESGEKIDVSLLVVYDGGVVSPIEEGTYNFTIVSNDPNANYVCDFRGTLTIFKGFVSNSGGAQVVSDGIGLSAMGIRIFEDKNSSLRSAFSALRDGRRCVSVYNFKTGEEVTQNGEVFTVSIKQTVGDDVKIYSVDKNGKMTAISYSIVNGAYVLCVNDLSASIIVTVSDNTMMYAKVISIAVILFLCYFITTTVRNQKRNRFYRRNTTVKYTDYNELKENEGIIEEVTFDAEIVSSDEFLNS